MEPFVVQSVAQDKQYKYPLLLLGLYLICLLSTVCLASRITYVGPLIQPGGIFLFPVTFTVCDIVGEVYGYSYPRLFIWIGAAAEFIFSISLISVAHMPYPVDLKHPEAYQIVFDPTFRYVCSGLVALLIGEFTNVYILAKWKIRLRGRLFYMRSIVSTALGQAMLTIIVDLLNYSGKLTNSHLVWMMFSGYIWKMGFALLAAYPAWLIVKKLKQVENVDYFDVNTNFNPFSLSLNNKSSD